MKVLVDTCIWSLALRRPSGNAPPAVTELGNLIGHRRVEVIGPVRQELLSGIRDEAQFNKLATYLAAFRDLPLSTEDYVTAAEFFNRCRTRGIQGSNTDFLICAVAVRNGLAVYTTDRDFVRFAKHLPVTLYETSHSD